MAVRVQKRRASIRQYHIRDDVERGEAGHVEGHTRVRDGGEVHVVMLLRINHRLFCCWLLCSVCCGLSSPRRGRRSCWLRARREGGIGAPKPIEAYRLRPNDTIGARRRAIRADAEHVCGQHAALAKAQDDTALTFTGRMQGRTKNVTRGESARLTDRTAIERKPDLTARTVWR